MSSEPIEVSSLTQSTALALFHVVLYGAVFLLAYLWMTYREFYFRRDAPKYSAGGTKDWARSRFRAMLWMSLGIVAFMALVLLYFGNTVPEAVRSDDPEGVVYAAMGGVMVAATYIFTLAGVVAERWQRMRMARYKHHKRQAKRGPQRTGPDGSHEALP